MGDIYVYVICCSHTMGGISFSNGSVFPFYARTHRFTFHFMHKDLACLLPCESSLSVPTYVLKNRHHAPSQNIYISQCYVRIGDAI